MATGGGGGVQDHRPAHQRLPRPLRADQPGSTSACSPEDNAEGKCFGGMARVDDRHRGRQGAARQLASGRCRRPVPGHAVLPVLRRRCAGGDDEPRQATTRWRWATTSSTTAPRGLRVSSSRSGFRLLMSNADIASEPALSDAIQSSVVLEKAGERIGLIGVTPVSNPELSSPGPNITFTDPSPAIQAEDRPAHGGRCRQDHPAQPLGLSDPTSSSRSTPRGST